MQMYSFRRQGLTLFCSTHERRNFMKQAEIIKFTTRKGGIHNMTDSEKLDLLLQKTISTENEVRSLRNDMDELKQDVAGLKQDMGEVKSDIVYLKTEVIVLRSDVNELKQDINEVKVDLKESHRYSDIILDEVKRVHGILDQHKADKSIHTP